MSWTLSTFCPQSCAVGGRERGGLRNCNDRSPHSVNPACGTISALRSRWPCEHSSVWWILLSPFCRCSEGEVLCSGIHLVSGRAGTGIHVFAGKAHLLLPAHNVRGTDRLPRPMMSPWLICLYTTKKEKSPLGSFLWEWKSESECEHLTCQKHLHGGRVYEQRQQSGAHGWENRPISKAMLEWTELRRHIDLGLSPKFCVLLLIKYAPNKGLYYMSQLLFFLTCG